MKVQLGSLQIRQMQDAVQLMGAFMLSCCQTQVVLYSQVYAEDLAISDVKLGFCAPSCLYYLNDQE